MVWFALTVRKEANVGRDELVAYLEKAGIQTRMLFAGNITKHPCFDEMRQSKEGYRIVGTLKNTDFIMENTFWLGVYPGIQKEQLDYIVKALTEASYKNISEKIKSP